MARINVEDDFWTDPRREIFGKLVGDQEKADGRMLRAWRVAQPYARKDERIPFKLWDTCGFEHVIESGLAERRDDGVYVCGSKEHFGWLQQRVEAGHKGGKQNQNLLKQKQNLLSKKPFCSSKRQASTLLYSDSVSVSDSVSKNKRVNPVVSAFDLDFTAHWLSWAKTQLPSLRANEEKWRDSVRLLRERDGLSEAELTSVLEFIKGDEFWSRNAISLPGLRQRSKNGLTKLENIRVKMQTDAPPAPDDWKKYLTPEERADLERR